MKKSLFLLLSGVLLLLLPAGVYRTAALYSLFKPDSGSATSRDSSSPVVSYSSFDTIKTNLREYIWPTDASTRITSTFAEYRSTHFHGGIDISTNGVTGYHVFAVREGYIYRVKTMPDGYGKMLFVKHPDGYVSTYAHLKAFNEGITKAVREEQYRRGSYSIDLTLQPGRLPVNKGDVIAYTGNSGFGPPHLHFELRDENLNPINPLLLKTYAIEDNIPPTILRMMVSPLRYNSSVDNGATPKFFSRFPGKNHHLRVPQRIRVEGEIGFAVEAIDRANNSTTHFGIHRMEFYVDDSLLYAMQLDRAPDEETKEIDLAYDLPSIVAGTGRFQKLYIDVGNTLPFYEHRPQGSGLIETKNYREGEHHYRIVCYDFSSNRTDLDGDFVVMNKPVLKIASADDRSIRIEGGQLASITRYIVQGRRVNDRRWSQHTLTEDRFERSGNATILPVNNERYDVLKVIGETESGIESAPLFYFKRKPTSPRSDAVLNIQPRSNYTEVLLTTRGMFTTPPNILVKEGALVRSVPLEALDVNKYSGAYIPSDSYEGTREVDATVEVDGSERHMTKTFDLYAISADRNGTFSVDYGALIISFDSGAVYQPLYLKIGRDYYNGMSTYTLDPVDVLLNRGITVSLPKPSNSRYGHLGLYYRSNNGWRFRTGITDSNRAYFSTTLTRTLGEVGIFGDDQPPSVGRLRIRGSRGIAAIAFSYHDNFSGVDPEEIKLYIDNKIAIPEIDEGKHYVWFQSEAPLARGKHTVTILVPDRAGNLTKVDRTLSIR